MTNNLTRRSVSAVAWSLIDVGGRQGIQFVVTVFLARLLSPSDYGLVGMLSLFMAVAQSFLDSGFGSALIQRKTITEADKSSVFLFNIFAGILLASIISLVAPWIAGFYHQPLLVPLTRVMSLNLFLGSFAPVQTALMKRNLDFQTQCKASVIASVISGVIAISMALKGWGVWSLVAQYIASTVISTSLIWTLSPWKPSWQFSIASLRSLSTFGSRVLGSGILHTFFDRVQLMVIGKAFSVSELGLYSRAFTTQQIPASLLAIIVSRVAYPLFSSLAGSQQELKPYVRKSLMTVMIPTLPIMVGLALIARPAVMVLFGQKWLPCVPYLQILSISGVLWPLHEINMNVLMAVGRSDLYFRAELASKILISLALLATYKLNVTAMVWALLIVGIARLILNAHYSKKLINYGFLDQIFDLAPYAGVTISMGAVTWAVGLVFPRQPIVHLVTAIFASAGFYCAVCYLLRLESFRSSLAAVAALFTKEQVPSPA